MQESKDGGFPVDLKVNTMLERTQSPEERATVTSWTLQDERRLRWKLDLYVLPLLVLGFFVLQLDRSNISNALTDTIVNDLGITTGNVNVGSQLLAAGIVIAEIPSNLILQRLGAPIWITAQIGVWGTVALTQAWCTGLSSFYATRFLLGIFEGGYIPGCQYTLALFYTEKELATRTAIFYFGNYFSTATGSLIAAGILKMGGIHGLAGWQWLFIIEGAITLFAFVIFALLLPGSPYDTKPVHGLWDFLSDPERVIMQARVVRHDVSKGTPKAHINVRNFLEAILDIRLWLHLALNVLSLAPKAGLQLYSPTIIASLGFDKTRANLLNSVSSFIVVILSFGISLASDRTALRGPWCIAAFTWSIAFSGALMGLPVNSGKWTKYAILTLLSGGNALAQGLNDAWININATSASKRSLGLAFVVMRSNIGGIVGPQLFQPSDAPKYTHGFMVILILYSSSIAMTLVIMAVYWRDNKAEAKRHAATGSAEEEQHGHGPRKFQI